MECIMSPFAPRKDMQLSNNPFAERKATMGGSECVTAWESRFLTPVARIRHPPTILRCRLLFQFTNRKSPATRAIKSISSSRRIP